MTAFTRCALFATTAVLCVASPTYAQTRSFDVPAQSLDRAVSALGRQADIQIVAVKKLTRGKSSRAVKGSMTAEQALAALLQGSGLAARRLGANSYTIVADPNVAGAVADAPARGQAAGSPKRTASLEGDDQNTGVSASASAGDADEILVTGTHIPGGGAIGSTAISIDRKKISEIGRATVAETIQTLPQNVSLGSRLEAAAGAAQNFQLSGLTAPVGANLRGLGTDATLTLLNGRRMAPTGYGTVVDLSQIPLSAVDRIDVVADGASAIYGSDAVGGVVNIILRRDFSGFETAVRADFASNYRQYQFSQAMGHAWTTGNILVALDYQRNSRLAATDRSRFTDDLRAFGGLDQRSTFANPGTISAGGRTYAIPSGQDGRGLSASSLVAGTSNKVNYWSGLDAIPQVKRWSVIASGHQDLGAITLSFDALFSRKELRQNTHQVDRTLNVPIANPFFVTPVAGARTVSVQYSFLRELGPAQLKSDVDDYSITGGLDWRLSSDWLLTASATQSVDDQNSITENLTNSFYLNQALADINAATALNVFGDGTNNNPATLATLRGFSASHAKFRQRTASLNLGGSLFDISGGAVRIAIGGEIRGERLINSSTSFTTTSQSSTLAAAAIDKNRSIKAVYGELSVPLVSASNELPGIRELTLTGALRYEHYNDFGNSINPKLGARYEPFRGLAVRGTYGTSFKAPTLQALGQPTLYNSTTRPDPSSPTGTINVLQVQGGNPGLGPEKATTWSAGFDARPFTGFKVGVSYFNIDYRDRILSLNGGDLSVLFSRPDIYSSVIVRNIDPGFVQAAYASPFFLAGTQFPVSQLGAIILAGPVNIGKVRQAGIDIDVNWTVDTRAGRFAASASATHLTQYNVKRTATSAAANNLDQLGFPLSWRGRGGLSWSRGAADAGLFVNYVGSYNNISVTPSRPISSWTTFDLHLGVSSEKGASGVMGGLRVALDVRNLFNRAPPVVANAIGLTGYDGDQASILGRVVSLSVRKSW